MHTNNYYNVLANISNPQNIQQNCQLSFFVSVDKNDGASFSRSRSSSMSSLENVSKEAIQCLVFADSYTRKFGRLEIFN